MDALKQEYQYYLAHKTELDLKYSGKAVVIKADTVIGAYSSRLEAVKETQGKHKLGTFLVQICGPECAVPLVFSSRVSFS